MSDERKRMRLDLTTRVAAGLSMILLDQRVERALVEAREGRLNQNAVSQANRAMGRVWDADLRGVPTHRLLDLMSKVAYWLERAEKTPTKRKRKSR